MGNTCCNFSCLKDVELHPAVVDPQQLKYPIQCVDNCDGHDGQVVFDSESFLNFFHSISQPNISIQCLENRDSEDGIVVIDRESFPVQCSRCISQVKDVDAYSFTYACKKYYFNNKSTCK